MKADDGQGKSRLGRGLAALIGDDAAFELGDANDAGRRGIKEVPIEFLRPNPFQPRQNFREEDLVNLSDSIREKGVLQPIVVRPIPGEEKYYEIVAGERRWRASQRAQLHKVPVIVKDLSDNESLEISIIENVQRADLNAVEEAMGYQRLVDQFSYTQEQLSKIIGKSRSHVANLLRLLGLPESVRALIGEGDLSAGHARTLIGHPEAESLALKIVREGMSVRGAEALARADKEPKPKSSKKAKSGHVASSGMKDADTRALEKNISDALGLAVSVDHHGDEGGDVTISYITLEQLDEICRRLAHGPL